MPCTKERLLIVDDEPSIRESLSSVLTEIGYPVRAAEDGFSALAEIRREIPDMILSDLNMPGMSGYEFIAVVRRRFPAIPVIAMSGAFSGDEVPFEVPADAFYRKGGGVRSLLKIMESLAPPKRTPVRQPSPRRPSGLNETGAMPTEGLMFRSPARNVCGISIGMSAGLSALFARHIAPIAGTRFLTRSSSRSMVRLRRLLQAAQRGDSLSQFARRLCKMQPLLAAFEFRRARLAG
jgi:CheY-like chemotaxis protein